MSLQVRDLNISYKIGKGSIRAINRVYFQLEKGDSLGVIGETGSGKTTIANAIMRALPENAEYSGSIFFNNKDILKMDQETYRKEIRWKKISIIPQYSMNAFNPIKRVGEQLVKIMMENDSNIDTSKASERIFYLFNQLSLPPEIYKKLPDELSGGQRQRVVIASALLLDPELVIADEPTTALDVINQARVISLIKREIVDKQKTLIYITHDIAVVAGVAKKVLTLYAGEIMEFGDSRKIFKEPLHPYSKGLLSSVPDIRFGKVKKVHYIPGDPPDLSKEIKGCPFAPRCSIAKDICKVEKPKLRYVDGRYVACHLVGGEENGQ
ncbi:ABC transporter ATP-binding protein [Saccharolobus solfataricus]|uniref:Oligo/dipeptide transport, ATP binding protein. (DppD-2) n=3 Tax=Saccharolobus solfataricus TaxID=2287 RepID=Q97YP3_SACS2|nr:ABC transporter ATP-binding protein [Saccharolobus solfataricus]AAK41519.1 Oligo/dipeptide transport, ATP binding protein . (dppD-2) [Saccharolobus solfataricus P2]AKA74443.1 ABC transporter ATP-binding protein [Saccharolobus solfataricus]AKA77138.1 ABC transporter ATP-binding protein [Saccharolobus solfataricus]AKA79831.1 ABC transporter ATP-binding protein [Saccharolobus solfataricus]AZF68922.1 ABC transporter ATP-binding protein [Saccharolobus solfataricus]